MVGIYYYYYSPNGRVCRNYASAALKGCERDNSSFQCLSDVNYSLVMMTHPVTIQLMNEYVEESQVIDDDVF